MSVVSVGLRPPSVPLGAHATRDPLLLVIAIDSGRGNENHEENKHLDPPMPEAQNSWTFLLHEQQSPFCLRNLSCVSVTWSWKSFDSKTYKRASTKYISICLFTPLHSLFRIYIAYLSLASLNEIVNSLKLGDKCDNLLIK